LLCVKFAIFIYLLTKRLCIEQDYTGEGHTLFPKTQASVMLVSDNTTRDLLEIYVRCIKCRTVMMSLEQTRVNQPLKYTIEEAQMSPSDLLSRSASIVRGRHLRSARTRPARHLCFPPQYCEEQGTDRYARGCIVCAASGQTSEACTTMNAVDCCTMQ
jgi:hypothetical protein